MSDPRRWYNDPSELTDIEQRALSAGRDASPAVEFTEDVWQALSAKLAGPGGDSGDSSADGAADIAAETLGSSASTTQAAGLVSLVKSAAVGAALGTLVMGGVAVFDDEPTTDRAPPAGNEQRPANASQLDPPRSTAHAPSALEPLRQTPETQRATPRNATPERHPEPLRERPSPSSAATAAFPDAASPQNGAGDRSKPTLAAARSREESQLVASARQALRGGNSAIALALLEQARIRFANGVLAQEREALTIEALAQSGQGSAARARARQFISAYPTSPHIARVQGVVNVR